MSARTAYEVRWLLSGLRCVGFKWLAASTRTAYGVRWLLSGFLRWLLSGFLRWLLSDLRCVEFERLATSALTVTSDGLRGARLPHWSRRKENVPEEFSTRRNPRVTKE